MSTNPLYLALHYQKSTCILEILSLGQLVPLCIHKIHLQTSIDNEEYQHIDLPINKDIKLKHYETSIGPVNFKNVIYNIYPKGKVMIYISCSERPFRIETNKDVSTLTAFLSQVRDRLIIDILKDKIERVIPNVLD